MDWSNLTFQTARHYPQGEICYDDQPVESLLYLNDSAGRATPADIITLWNENSELTEKMKKVLIRMLIKNIDIVYEMSRQEELRLYLKSTLVSKTTVNPGFRILILFLLWRLEYKAYPIEGRRHYQRAETLIGLYGDKVDEPARKAWGRWCREAAADADPCKLRSEAWCSLEKKEYAKATGIYRKLIKIGFELPGSYCHLARVQLLMHKEAEAARSISCAWKKRKVAMKYVVPRIIFFKILFLLIRNHDPGIWIGRLKTALKDKSSFMDWSIQSTLYEYQLRMTPDNFKFMKALAEVLQDTDNLEGLEQFEMWKNQIAVEPD